MPTIRLVDAKDVNGQRVPCRHCGEYLVEGTDDEGREVWECIEGCLPVYPNVGGYATEGAPAGTWPVEACADCQAEVIPCTSIRGLRMFVDADPVPWGLFSLHPVAGQVPLAQYDWGHRTRALYRVHVRACRVKQVAS